MQSRSGTASCGDIELFYEDLGELDAPPVVLIMGVGAQLPMWPDGLCAQLIKHGYRVIRFDHRDTGLSTKMRGMRAEGSVYKRLGRYILGRRSPVPYTLVDLAGDVAGRKPSAAALARDANAAKWRARRAADRRAEVGPER